MTGDRSVARLKDRTKVRSARVGGGALALIGILSCAHGEPTVVPLPRGIDPASVELALGKSQQFTATGASEYTHWRVDDAGDGIVSSSGFYEAPFAYAGAPRTLTLHAEPGGRTASITLLAGAPDPRDCCGSGQDALPAFTDAVGFDEAPVVLSRVEPQYPELAREARVTGTIQMRVLICKNGLIYDIKVVPGRTVPMLEAAAISSVEKWRFKPARANGLPVAAWTVVDVKFELP